MLHDDYLCLVESGKQQIKEVIGKFHRKTWKQRQLLSECGFVLRIAPSPEEDKDEEINQRWGELYTLAISVLGVHMIMLFGSVDFA